MRTEGRAGLKKDLERDSHVPIQWKSDVWASSKLVERARKSVRGDAAWPKKGKTRGSAERPGLCYLCPGYKFQQGVDKLLSQLLAVRA